MDASGKTLSISRPAATRIRPRLGPDDADVVTAPPKARTQTRTKARVARPQMYRVVMLNDDYTPMEFVVVVLKEFFGMPETKAVAVMLSVHTQGRAVIGLFTYDIAETKVTAVMEFARRHEYPLRCLMEPE